MTIDEFRSDPEKVAGLRVALAQPALQEAMSILGKGPPNKIILTDITDTFACIKLGHFTAWSEYHETLEAMATHAGKGGDLSNERLESPEEE